VICQTPAAFARSLLVNAGAVQHLAHRFAPALRTAGEGSLLFTGNGFALTPRGQGFGTLSAGKSAMRSVALTLAQDLAGTKQYFAHPVTRSCNIDQSARHLIRLS
jgi:NAD(P)-dependent dehydrogenase (short-subunit alcohol dehydrogenase family)